MRSTQSEHLESQQLSRLLDWLTQASPAILVRPQASASSAEAGADRKDAEMRDWICQLATASSNKSRCALLPASRHAYGPFRLLIINMPCAGVPWPCIHFLPDLALAEAFIYVPMSIMACSSTDNP